MKNKTLILLVLALSGFWPDSMAQDSPVVAFEGKIAASAVLLGKIQAGRFRFSYDIEIIKPERYAGLVMKNVHSNVAADVRIGGAVIQFGDVISFHAPVVLLTDQKVTGLEMNRLSKVNMVKQAKGRGARIPDSDSDSDASPSTALKSEKSAIPWEKPPEWKKDPREKRGDAPPAKK